MRSIFFEVFFFSLLLNLANAATTIFSSEPPSKTAKPSGGEKTDEVIEATKASKTTQDSLIEDGVPRPEISELSETKDDDFGMECQLQWKTIDHIRSYQGVVNQIISHVVNGKFKGKTFEKLAELTDTFGARMTGSKELERAVDWMATQFTEAGITDIHTEAFLAPHWVRNKEYLTMLHPRVQKMNLLGLGSSIGTATEGITAEIFVVSSFEELEKNSEKAKGKIVVFNPPWVSYGTTVKYRKEGATRASRHGAVAALVRSVTQFSINSPHTGWQSYGKEAVKIPVACITVEDAEMLHRFQEREQKVVMHLKMEAENLPPFTARNTVAQLAGSEKPGEVVVVSGHLDSWDVGVGAMDDGGGTMISYGVPIILKELNLKPKRTVRTVLFTGEEQGLWGGNAYFNKHYNGSEKFQLLLESDIGTFAPLGLSFSGPSKASCVMKEILSLLSPLNATKLVSPMRGGPDISFWKNAGVPTGALHTDNGRYFWFHHSDGDKMTVEDSDSLDRCLALWTAVAYVAADMNISLSEDFSYYSL